MKNWKKGLAIGLMMTVLGVGTAFAAETFKNPAEILAGLTGKTVEQVEKERWDGHKSYGQMADEAGKWSEFRKANIAERQKYVDQQVKDGKMSQERGTFIKERIGNGQGEGCYDGGRGHYGQGGRGSYHRGYHHGSGMMGGSGSWDNSDNKDDNQRPGQGRRGNW